MGGDKFKPIWHGLADFDATSPAILDASTVWREQQATKAEQPQSTGFTQVHVSGLPADCEDDAVESKLRQVLLDARRRAAAEAAAALPTTALEPVAEDAAPELPSALNAEEAAEYITEGTAEGEIADAGPVTDGGAGDGGASPRSTVAAEEPLAAAAEPFASCSVVRDKVSGECKGYCFLAFETLAEAETAVQHLDEVAEVAGCQVRAQLSKPKTAKAKPPKPQPPAVHDLRIRRQRYPAVSKHAQYGHLTVSSGRDEGGAVTVRRNQHGRISGVCGTRGGKPIQLDDSKCSSRSGFS